MSRLHPPEHYLGHDGAVLAFAHRGGAHHPDLIGLENSARAFQHAHDLGYTYLETDVHVSADGVLFAFHDDVLDRVTDSSGTIADLPADVIRQARIAGTERIPEFAELLIGFPDSRINVDLKSDGAVQPLADVLTTHDAWHRVMVGSFSRRRLRHFRRVAGAQGLTSGHPGEVAAYRLLPSAWLARLLTPGRPLALQIPVRRKNVTVLTRGVIRRAHRNGIHVHVWTIDDPSEMDTLITLGVDGIMTDRTDLLVTTLTRHGLWKDRS